MMNKYLLALALPATSLANGDVEIRLGNMPAETKLPKPLSDVSASVGQDGHIYIAGGCDSAFGSQYSDEEEKFLCNSVSSSFYAFDPETEQFTTLPDMPAPRYRHAAVAINNQIWLVGGRDVDDQVQGEVHVFDINDGRWRRFRDLIESYWVSDLGGFSAEGRAFFMGGFTEDYRAVRRVFSIDPATSWENGELDVLRHSNLLHRRGDIGVTIDANETFAYVSGGSSHVNQFCAPLNTTEKYDIANNGWEEMAPLTTPRSGKTVVELKDQLVALGGAQQVNKLCNQTGSSFGNMQTPVYDVEVYDQGEWGVVDELSAYRFRSTSVVYDDAVYSFGGQSAYFTVCQCHPTVDDVTIYRQTEKEDPTFTTDYEQANGDNNTGFGTYNRDGAALNASGTGTISSSFLLTATLGAVAGFFM